ncbi:hypothetical protein DCAR_0831666 [Daucus carota subsp. sativus]|uniref:Uncharacterized protein n=1 Tax=Daucus carota subsp. sativus TaxID=79200 RepID=A0A175YNS3_DAUCS|nr:hypothetical protein DCAR_0831666 [Daucus carota subsp. sativus]
MHGSRQNTSMLFAGGGGGISTNPNARRSIRLEFKNVSTSNRSHGACTNLCEFVGLAVMILSDS